MTGKPFSGSFSTDFFGSGREHLEGKAHQCATKRTLKTPTKHAIRSRREDELGSVGMRGESKSWCVGDSTGQSRGQKRNPRKFGNAHTRTGGSDVQAKHSSRNMLDMLVPSNWLDLRRGLGSRLTCCCLSLFC